MVKYKGKAIHPYESFYWNTTQEFFRGELGGGIARCVKCDDSLATLVMEEIKVQQVLNIVDDTNIGFKNPQRGRVYSVDGLSPCLNCCEGGGLEPKVMEPMCSVHPLSHKLEFNPETSIKDIAPALRATDYKAPHVVWEPQFLEFSNFISLGTQNNSYNRVWKVDNYCGALNCTKQMEILEPQVMTPKRTDFGKAIRKKYEQGNIQMSRHDMTELEPRQDGISNTLTSVQKDNLVVEPKIIQKFGDRGTDQYSIRDYAHTIPVNPMSDRQQMVIEPEVMNPLKGQTDNGWHYEQQIYSEAGITRAVKAGGGSGNIPKVIVEDNEQWNTIIGNKQLNPFRGSVDGTSPCITSACGMGGGMTPMLTDADLETTKQKEFIEQIRGHKEMEYRIRKLTPKECFRLMGVDDEDIDKIQASGISNSSQYKLAGNSIVVDVLYHIFRKAFVEKDNESQQLTFF